MSTDTSLPPPNVDENHSSHSSLSSFVPIENTMEDAIQVINEDKEFNKDILTYINKTTNSSIGNKYHIISVFGSQSTGKSTLLNKLFNTNFDVMDETNRQQTTKGIWMAHAPTVSSNNKDANMDSSIFVMDVEGTDGRERGEDQDFERKAALFALSTSEILIINIWEHQIGLYQGANMGLLKTVFEVNLSLFGKAKLNKNTHKVLLLFVIRDHIGNTPKENLASTVKQDLLKMWEGLSKPSEVSDLNFDDFFDIDFQTLSHKVLQPDNFNEDVKLLGDRILDKNDLFKPYYHHNIPVDGWTMYAENCWDQIDNNKDLDLPTQQILVAKFKCDEISKAAFDDFIATHDEMKLVSANIDVKNIKYEEVGSSLAELQDSTLQKYDELASRYNKSVYESKRDSLNGQIYPKLAEIAEIYVQHLNNNLLEVFKKNLFDLKGKSFNEEVNLLKTQLFDDFDKVSQLLSLRNQLSFEKYATELKTGTEKLISKQQTSELNNIIQKILKKTNNSLSKAIQFELNDPNENTWDNILEKFHSTQNELLGKYETENGYDFGLGTTEDKNLELVKSLKFKAWTNFHEICTKLISKETLFNLLKDRFDDMFRYDENGLPKLYQNTRELEANFAKAKTHALKIMPILSIAKRSDGTEILPEYDIFDSKLRNEYLGLSKEDDDSDDDVDEPPCFAEIISEKDKSEIMARFKKETDARFIETKRSIVQHITQIPYYIYLVILVLGWNEFMAVLRNPFFFTLDLLTIAGVFVLYQLNLLSTATTILQRVIQEAIDVAKEKLRLVLIDDVDLQNKGRASKKPTTDNSESIEMSTLED